MLNFKRKFSTKIQRNAAFFGLSFVAVVIGWSCIMTYGFPELANQKINEAFFGKSFTVGLAWAISGLFVYAFLGYLLTKAGYITYPTGQISREEIETYNHKYGAEFKMPPIKQGHYLQLFLSLFIPWGVILLAYLIHPELSPLEIQVLLGLGVTLMLMGFYGAVGKIMKKNKMTMLDVFQHANEHIPETNIKTSEQNLDNWGDGKINYELHIEGLFKGRKIALDYGVSGKSTGRGIKTAAKGGLSMELQGLKDMNFSISEKKPHVDKVEGATLDQCFEKRFKVKGVKIVDLPAQWKKELLESFRSIDLKVEDHIINQSVHHTYYLPFYSAQGILLFLDFLLKLEESLKAEE